MAALGIRFKASDSPGYRLARRTRDALLAANIEPLTEAEGQAWAETCPDLSQWNVMQWVKAGFRLPDERPPVGLTFEDFRYLQRLGIEPTSADWAGAYDRCAPTLKALGAVKKPPAQIIALARALEAATEREAAAGRARGDRRYRECRRSSVGYCLTSHPKMASIRAQWLARKGRALNWGDLGLCLDAGLTFDEAVAHVREGRDMEPVRVLAALA